MFCPSCGFEYTQKTNYCKRCGEDLGLPGGTDAPKKTQPTSVVEHTTRQMAGAYSEPRATK